MLQRFRSWAAAAAVAALLLAQAFGLAHRIEHEVGHRSAGFALAQGPASAEHDRSAHDAAQPDAAACDDHAHGHAGDPAHGHDAAFGATHEEGSATCRLIDQAAHADAAPAASMPASLPAAAPAVPAPKRAQAFVKAGAQPYRARGPPPHLV